MGTLHEIDIKKDTNLPVGETIQLAPDMRAVCLDASDGNNTAEIRITEHGDQEDTRMMQRGDLQNLYVGSHEYSVYLVDVTNPGVTTARTTITRWKP